MTERKLNDNQERSIAFEYLCGIPVDNIMENYGVSKPTIRNSIVAKRSKDWNSPLIEQYRSQRNKDANFAHLYFWSKNEIGPFHIAESEQAPSRYIINGRILAPIDEIREKLSLDHYLGRVLTTQNSNEDKLLRDIFGEGLSFEYNTFGDFQNSDLLKESSRALLENNLHYLLAQSYRGDPTKIRLNKTFENLEEMMTQKIIDGKLVNNWEKRDEINKVLNTLTHREKEIVELRYGLNGKEKHTLMEVSNKYEAITPKRVSQIQNKALRKLCHPFRANNLEHLKRSLYHRSEDLLPYDSTHPDFEDLEKQRFLATSIQNLGISLRSKNILAKDYIFTLNDLVNTPVSELSKYDQWGKTTENEIVKMLAEKDLNLRH